MMDALPALLAPYSAYILALFLLSEALAVLPFTQSSSVIQLVYSSLKKALVFLGIKRPE